MWSNYLKITVRNLLRHKGYSLINVLGLAIGMACCIVILLYIQDELSYDRFHEKADQMYRLVDEQRTAGRVIQTAGTPAPWGPALQKDYPEVLNYVRMRGTLAAWLISYQEKHFYEKRLFWVDKTLFDVFTFPLIKGNPSTALKEPYSMVISEEMARKYFGDDDPMGKVINADNAWDFRVTGVMRNLPSNSHFQADMFASFSSLIAINGPQFVNDWSDHNNFYTYLLLRKDSPSAELEKKLPGFIHKYLGAQLQQVGMELRPSLQRVTEIHLHSRLNEELAPNSDIAYVYIFAAIALFIVLIACINFMNLATARSATRAKEVGLRKVVGASRPQLIKQFLGESIFTAAIALVLAVVVVVVTRPVLTALSGKALRLDLIASWVWLSLIGLVVFVGVVAGSYPAVFLSAFQPVDVLKGTQKVGAARFVLRRLLVVGQFAMSIILIVAAGIVYDQLNYITHVTHQSAVPVT